MSYHDYLALFRAPQVLDTPFKVVSTNLKIEVFNQPRSYTIPKLIIDPSGRNLQVFLDTITTTHGQTYVALSTRTKESNPAQAEAICKAELSLGITIISMVRNPRIFSEVVYEGWVARQDEGMASAWANLGAPVKLDDQVLPHEYAALQKVATASTDDYQRIALMSKMFSRSLQESPGEEKFLWLWTMFEVFPMKNTSNIKPIAEYLAPLVGKSSAYVKDRLQIGRLYGHRCSLVHNGELDIPLHDLGTIITKMEAMTSTVLRSMLGLPYDGRLDRYL